MPTVSLDWLFNECCVPEPNSGCWLWLLGGSDRYGKVRHDGRDRLAHIVAYELVNGPVPYGLVLDHKCRVTWCINPDHVEPVTQSVNVLRGKRSALKAPKTHCPRGHAYVPGNIRRASNGSMNCLTCAREKYHERKGLEGMSNQNDGPPAGQFPDDSGSAPQRNQSRGNGNFHGARQQRRDDPQFNVEAERQAFLHHVTDPAMQAEYAKLLGPDIDVKRFVSTAIDAVEQKPDLLNPAFRTSLFFALKKAAKQGLKPDGKEGALVPRWDNDAKTKVVQWQPMVWGVVRAGRRAGAVKKITADLVFAGEPFRFIKGDEERIEHEWLPDVRSRAYALLRPVQSDVPEDGSTTDIQGFWDQVAAAYCIVESPDGTKTRRAMPRERLLNLRDFSRAKGGPWNSVWLDEMMLKAAVLFTMKHVETDTADEKVRAFREALEQDMDVDLDENDGPVIEQRPTAMAALPAPGRKLDNIMDQLNAQKAREAEKIQIGATSQQDDRPQQRQQQMPAQADAGEGRPSEQTVPGKNTENPPQSGAGGAPASAPVQRTPPSDQQPNQERQEARQAPPSTETRQQPQETKKATQPPPAAVVAPNSPEAAARKFVSDTKQDIAMTASQEGIDAVLKNKAIASRIARLQEVFPKLYDELMGAISLKQQSFGPPDAMKEAA